MKNEISFNLFENPTVYTSGNWEPYQMRIIMECIEKINENGMIVKTIDVTFKENALLLEELNK